MKPVNFSRSSSFESTWSASTPTTTRYSSVASNSQANQCLNRVFYDCSKVLASQKEGKKRREAIASRASAKKNEIPVYYGTIPLSQATNLYERSMRMNFEKEKRLRKMKQAALPVFCTTTVPLSRACDLYDDHVRWALRCERKRALKAREYNTWGYEFPYSKFSCY